MRIKINRYDFIEFKIYDKIIVKLKTIKYKEDFFCYLFFYLQNLGF